MSNDEHTSGLRLVAVNADLVVLAYLTVCKRPRSLLQIEYGLSRYASRDAIRQAVHSLLGKQQAEFVGNKISLSEQGYRESVNQFGTDVDKDLLVRSILPALALGIDPKSQLARTLRKPGKLLAYLLLRMAELPINANSLSLTTAATDLTKAELLRQYGTNFSARETRDSTNAQSTGQGESIHTLLILTALRHTGSGIYAKESDLRERPKTAYDNFATRVKQVVEEIASRHGLEAVTISDVYDAYHELYEDAGTLPSFKTRLLKAYADRAVQLEAASDERRLKEQGLERSETKGPRGTFHLVTRST